MFRNTRKKGQRDGNQALEKENTKTKVGSDVKEEGGCGDFEEFVIEYLDVLELGQADHWGWSKQRADRKVARGNALAVNADLSMSYSMSSCMILIVDVYV
jgi:hypothetical protein